jgi:hypothetical protein
VVEVVLAENIVGGAVEGGVRWVAWELWGRKGFWDVPYQCSPVGHGAHGANGPAYAGELEGAGRFGEGFVEAVFVHCAVAAGRLLVTSCVEGVVGALTGLRRCSCRLGSSRRSYTMAGYLVGVAVEPRARAAAGPRWRASHRWRRRKR